MPQTIIITGAAGRLGGYIVRRFAEADATIAALVLNEEEAERLSLPADSRAFTADTTNEAAVQAAFHRIGEHFNRLDALIHTVGGWGAKPLLETSLKDWEGLVRLNLTSTFLCFREAARLMQQRGGGGRLIGIASGQGADRGVAEQGAYSAGKAGVMRLVEAAADEFSGTGITAHAIAPSSILFEEHPDRKGVAAERIADLCHYLCTAAGEALNGATLRAYGSRR